MKNQAVTVDGIYQEYDDNGEVLFSRKVKATVCSGENPPILSITLPENEIEKDLGIHKEVEIEMSSLGYRRTTVEKE